MARVAIERRRLEGRPDLGDGRVLTVNGLEHDVVLDRSDPSRQRDTVHRRLTAHGDGIRGELHVALRPAGHPAPLLERWLRDEARRVLTARVSVLGRSMGVSPTRITIRGQRSRWGSASRDGSLSFNWRLVLAPTWVLDCVVVHELAHLRKPGHSAAFWSVVRAHAPRTDDSRRWLRANHRELLAALE
jgi:predicted metal-dependent hydrolase